MFNKLCCEILEHIADNDELYRRFRGDQFKEDGTVSSAAFQNEDLSVNLGRLSSIEATSYFNESFYGVASFNAGHARKNKLIVYHDPDYHEYENYAHTTVKGKKTGAIRKSLARGATVRFNPFNNEKK